MLSLCLCCFQTLFLNNLVVSHCSLQMFLPCDPPESKETRVYVLLQYVFVCYVPSCILFFACCAILRELHLSGTTSSFISAKLVLFIVVPSWSQCSGNWGWTLWEAAVWCAIRGLEPWSRGEVMHNSHGLNLLYFITLTVWVSPEYLFIYFFCSC